MLSAQILPSVKIHFNTEQMNPARQNDILLDMPNIGRPRSACICSVNPDQIESIHRYGIFLLGTPQTEMLAIN